MNYLKHTQEEQTIVELEGEFDLACSPEVRKVFLETLELGHSLVIDLHAVTYIDSSGIASFVEAYQTAKKKKQRFALLCVSKAVINVLKLAKLDQIFPIYNDLQDYLQVKH